MTEDGALFWLLLLTVALGVLLVIASSAAFGRILADLEYQYAAGLNGVRRIQSKVNLRTQGNRIALGLLAIATGVLALTHAPLLWRVWAWRVLFAAVLALYTAASLKDWLDERKQVRLLLAERLGGAEPAPATDGEHTHHVSEPVAPAPPEVPR